MLLKMFLVRFYVLDDSYFRGTIFELLYRLPIFVLFKSLLSLLHRPFETWPGRNLTRSLFSHPLVIFELLLFQ